MSNPIVVRAPMLGSVVAVLVEEGNLVSAGDTLLVIEVMKVHSNIKASVSGQVSKILTATAANVEKGAPLLELLEQENRSLGNSTKMQKSVLASNSSTDLNTPSKALASVDQRKRKTLDTARAQARDKRVAKGYRTARENLNDLCDTDSFIEYGQFAVAAQRQRKDYEELQSTTAGDGILTGLATINANLYGPSRSKTAVIINDYSVLAGTQGYFHHAKLDRILAVAERQGVPVIMYSEGGGGRPGDTDITTVNSGLQCGSFGSWAALAGKSPRIAVANGYNFAGNAALFGAADITIATQKSWIGMAGPAMIAGGGLGDVKPTEIGPIDVQTENGVVDIVADDEAHATAIAKQVLGMFQGSKQDWLSCDQDTMREHLPDNRLFTYQIRDVINSLADRNSFIELKSHYGGAIVTGFIRLEGRPVGLIASDCNILGGAIDVDAGEKAADFLNLCSQFGIPLLSLCDTPGFMVGPAHEKLGAVRRLAKLFTAGAQLKVPLVAIVLRKCYGLGAQALLGGSTSRPDYTAAWPSGEFGPMGLEGGVKLGFSRELDAAQDEETKQALYDKLLAQAYQRGQASEVASVLEIDAVIDPKDTRATVIRALADATTA
jgi:acetyl-CoA carboxylase carboxyltransferase component